MARSTTIITFSITTLLSVTTPIEAQSGLCHGLGSLAESGNPVVFHSGEPLTARTVAMTALETELYRVTSAGFLSGSVLQVANAGTNEILLLDGTLSLTGRFGRSGGGPGEFGQLYFAHVTNGGRGIGAFDSNNRRITRFRADGEVVGTLTIQSSTMNQYYDAIPLDAGGALVMTRWRPGSTPLLPGSIATRPIPILHVGEDGSVRSVVASIPGQEQVISQGESGPARRLNAPYGVEPTWLASPDGCVVWLEGRAVALSFRIVGGGPPGRLPIGGINLEIGDAKWNAVVNQLAEAFRGYHPDEDPYGELQSPGAHQLASKLVYDGINSLWIERFHLRDEPAPGWWRLDLDSGRLGWLPAPEGTVGLMAADGQGQLAVLMKDQFDRERIALLRVSRAQRR